MASGQSKLIKAQVEAQALHADRVAEGVQAGVGAAAQPMPDMPDAPGPE